MRTILSLFLVLVFVTSCGGGDNLPDGFSEITGGESEETLADIAQLTAILIQGSGIWSCSDDEDVYEALAFCEDGTVAAYLTDFFDDRTTSGTWMLAGYRDQYGDEYVGLSMDFPSRNYFATWSLASGRTVAFEGFSADDYPELSCRRSSFYDSLLGGTCSR